jgi:hypothetical protein
VIRSCFTAIVVVVVFSLAGCGDGGGTSSGAKVIPTTSSEGKMPEAYGKPGMQPGGMPSNYPGASRKAPDTKGAPPPAEKK